MSRLPEVCVAYLVADGAVLLGTKLRGLGRGKIVAPGGKLEPGESAEAAVVRELSEETAIEVDAGGLVQVATVVYDFPYRREWSQRSNVFVGNLSSRRTPVPTAELQATWVPLDSIPFDRMWADAKEWLPLVLDGCQLSAHFEFERDNATVASRDIRIVSSHASRDPRL